MLHLYIASSKGIYEYETSSASSPRISCIQVPRANFPTQQLLTYEGIFLQVNDDSSVRTLEGDLLAHSETAPAVWTVFTDRFQDVNLVSLSEKTVFGRKKLLLTMYDHDCTQTYALAYPDMTGTGWTLAHMLQQDAFLYIVFCNFEIQRSTIAVYAPDFRAFGVLPVEHLMHHPVIKGFKILYTHSHSLYVYNMLTQKSSCLYTSPSPSDCIHAFYAHREEDIYVLSKSHIIRLCKDSIVTLDEYESCGYVYREVERYPFPLDHDLQNDLELDLDLGDVRHITDACYGNDYHHTCTDLRQSHVKTFFEDQMNEDERSLRRILLRVSETIYKHPTLKKDLATYVEHSDATVQDIARGSIYNCIFVGQDMMDILEPDARMFSSHRNYQHILKDMSHVYRDSDEGEHSNATCYQLQSMAKQMGVSILPQHVFSGKIHLMFPMHAKGWHHNIESVPKDSVYVVYFVCTDRAEFGGSFFFYRHPVSHQIHAVPDVHGTYKEFYLQSDPNNVLWHALGSFTAIRISLGLSYKQHMQSDELKKCLLSKVF